MTERDGPDGGPGERPWPVGPDADWWASEAGPSDPVPEPAAAPTTDATADGGADRAAQAEPAPPDSPYDRPPRVTRRATTPPARRVVTPPPAVLTAPTVVETPAGSSPPPAVGPFTVDTPAAPDPRADETGPIVPGPRRRPAASPAPPRGRRVQKRPRAPRPWLGLPALFLLLVLAMFVAWVSAEPFWLSVGHGHAGTATIVAGPDRCQATFSASDGGFTTSTVDLAGVRRSECVMGGTVAASMVSPQSARAFAEAGGLRLRWGVGALLLLLCGWGIAVATGAARFRGWRRITATGVSVAAPWVVALVVLAGLY